MKYFYTEYPKQIDRYHYEEAIARMSHKLMKTGFVKSVYQVGSTNNPGISDIDLYVVFNDNMQYLDNPIANLTGIDKYLFTHRLFGTSVSLANELRNYTFLGDFKLIEGEPILIKKDLIDETSLAELKHQVALEYLIKAWLSISMSMKLKTIKVRSFLLHAKAILYDLEFLGIEGGNLLLCITRIIQARDNWFVKEPGLNDLSELIHDYEIGLYNTILLALKKYKLHIPSNTNFKISRRVTINYCEDLGLIREGLIISSKLIQFFPILNKINSRLNYFTLNLPFNSEAVPEIIADRYKIISKAIRYNSVNLPGFICTGYAMNIFRKESYK